MIVFFDKSKIQDLSQSIKTIATFFKPEIKQKLMQFERTLANGYCDISQFNEIYSILNNYCEFSKKKADSMRKVKKRRASVEESDEQFDKSIEESINLLRMQFALNYYTRTHENLLEKKVCRDKNYENKIALW